jgi:dimethylargininase
VIALTRPVPASIDRCELTHLAREPIDYARGVEQHRAYEAALERLGCRIERLPATPDLPDSVFVEDAAVVFDDIAVITRPGAASRRGEVASVADALRRYRTLAFIEPPGTLDGGDVLVTTRGVFVGLSARSNADGIRQLAAILAPRRIGVTAVPVSRCLHLKSAVTSVGANRLLVNREWVDPSTFTAFDLLDVDPAEPFAANVLIIGDRVLCAAESPLTRARLEAAGLVTLEVPGGELAKAEGGVTCSSLLVSKPSHPSQNS